MSNYVNKNVNPKNKKGCDCVIRAFISVTNDSWDKIYIDLCKLGLEMKDMPNADTVWKKYLEVRKFVKHSIKVVKGGKRPTVNSFCEENKQGKYILSLAGHLVAVVDGKYIDIWDCGNKSVYGFYEYK